MGNVEITNMVMVEDVKSGKVVVINREKKYPGICFPGGHVEACESVYDSAVREIKEETGLCVWDLHPCGVLHWYHKTTGDWYIEYFYKTSDYSGELIERTDEGSVFWAEKEKLPQMSLSVNFDKYLPLFFDESITEGYCAWSDDMDAKDIIYR